MNNDASGTAPEKTISNRALTDMVENRQRAERIILQKGGKDTLGMLAVYGFYYHTGMIQKTFRPWVTNQFASKGLGIGLAKIKHLKANLTKLGLISTRKVTDAKGRFGKYFVEIVCLLNKSNSSSGSLLIPLFDISSGSEIHPLENRPTNTKEEYNTNTMELKGKRKEDALSQISTNKIVSDSNPSSKHSSSCCLQAALPLEEASLPKNKTTEYSSFSFPRSGFACCPSCGGIPPTSPEKENSVKEKVPKQRHVTKAEYIECMKKTWAELGIRNWKYILEADLDSNALRINWDGQLRYWDTRLADVATNATDSEIQTSAWQLIALYIKIYHKTNGVFPVTHKLFKHWKASEWSAQLTKIQAFCKAHDADTVVEYYVFCRASEGRPISARWLLSSEDYQKWFEKVDHTDYPEEDYAQEKLEANTENEEAANRAGDILKELLQLNGRDSEVWKAALQEAVSFQAGTLSGIKLEKRLAALKARPSPVTGAHQ